MDDKEFEVEVVHRRRTVYRVQAPDRQNAEEAAIERWKRGDAGEVPGFDWAELEAVHATEHTDPGRREQDAELVLRFLREREQLILRLGGGVFGQAGHDAISAGQVASDLGWVRRGRESTVVPDVARAIQALERLCEARRVVCFERPRVRSGERGHIRLYCTPEYLDRLSSSVDDLKSQAV